MSASNADLLEEGVTLHETKWDLMHDWHYACSHCRFISSTHEQESKIRYDAKMHALSTRHQNRKAQS